MNNLIAEELKKASLLFKYDTKKTLSENIVEQNNKPTFTPNPSVNQANLKYTPGDATKTLTNTSTPATAATTPAAPATVAPAATTPAPAETKTGLVYDYMYKNDKNYRYALTPEGKWWARNLKNDKTFDLSSNQKFKKTVDNLNQGLKDGTTKKYSFSTTDPANKTPELKLDTKIDLPTTKDLSTVGSDTKSTENEKITPDNQITPEANVAVNPGSVDDWK